MTAIRYVQNADKDFWYTLDRHLPETEFYAKVQDKRLFLVKGI